MGKRWKPEVGERYWRLTATIEVTEDFWVKDCEVDTARFEFGNCFETEAEAKAAAEKVKALLLSLHGDGENLQPGVATLPKLTEEVFDRPDCPKWAKWAIISPWGYIAFFKEKPEIYENGLILKGDYVYIWEKKYSAENWQNSIIERHAQFPDWAEVGGHVYDIRNGYGKIVSGSVKSCYIEFDGGAGDFVPEEFAELKRARLRPYNSEEIPDLPFEVTERNSNFRTTVVSCKGNKVWLAGASTAISAKELMLDFTAKGSRCGVLEHIENGEWVR